MKSTKFFTAIFLTIVLTTAAFGSELVPTASTSRSGSSFAIPSKAVAARNFAIGRDFAAAVWYARDMNDSDEDMTDIAILEIVYLADRLDSQPEAARLQTILRAMIRKTATDDQIAADIEAVFQSYVKRQNAGDGWYLNAGASMMNLHAATYFGDEAATKKRLSDLKDLVRNAPKGTEKQMIDQMNRLVEYGSKTTFSEDDLTAIGEIINSIEETMTA
jgi:hypothetical protein